MRKRYIFAAATLAVSLIIAPAAAAMAVGNNSLALNRTCYPNQNVFTMLNTGGATEYYWSSQQDRYNVAALTWSGAVSTTVATGYRNIYSNVYVTAGYVYASGTGTYCR